jgi:hypothetical protein
MHAEPQSKSSAPPDLVNSLRSALFGALVALLCAQLSAATPAKPAQNPKAASPPCCVAPTPAQPATPDIRGTPQAPLVVSATPVKTPDEIAAERAERAERENADSWARVIGLATIAVLLGQGIAFVFQAHRLKQSVDEMKRATEATQQVARAEQQTVQTMERTAIRQLQAYVHLLKGRAIGILSIGSAPRILLVFKNHGQTPAYRLKLEGLNHAWGRTFDSASDMGDPQDFYLGPMGPTAEINYTGDPLAPITADQINGMNQKVLAFFVFGTLRYEDAFKKARYVKFRLMIGGDAGTAQGDSFNICEEGNETDEPD